MMNRLRKLPVLVLVSIMFLLIYAALPMWDHSTLKSRVLHRCVDPNNILENCYITYYLGVAEERGSKTALAILHERMESDTKLSTNCHQAIHAIGRTAFHEYGSIAEAYGEADYSCWGGYLHGIVEAGVRSKDRIDVTPELLRATCEEVRGDGTMSFPYFSCVHGIGHALMYVMNNNLPDVLIRCDDMNNVWEARQCANGAFMENLLANYSDHRSDFLPKDDLHFPCNIVREKDQDVCYLVQGRFILDHFEWDFAKAFLFCSELAPSRIRTTCAEGLGTAVSNHSAYEPKRVVALCSLAPSPLDESCLYGALTDLEGVAGDTSLGTLVCKLERKDKQSVCFKIRDDAHKAFPGTTSNSGVKE